MDCAVPHFPPTSRPRPTRHICTAHAWSIARRNLRSSGSLVHEQQSAISLPLKLCNTCAHVFRAERCTEGHAVVVYHDKHAHQQHSTLAVALPPVKLRCGNTALLPSRTTLRTPTCACNRCSDGQGDVNDETRLVMNRKCHLIPDGYTGL